MLFIPREKELSTESTKPIGHPWTVLDREDDCLSVRHQAPILSPMEDLPGFVYDDCILSLYNRCVEYTRGLSTPHQKGVILALRDSRLRTGFETITPLEEEAPIVKLLQEKDWEISLLRGCTLLKFSQHPQHASALMHTTRHPLVYMTNADSYWGKTLDEGQGENHYGLLLESIRSQLTQEWLEAHLTTPLSDIIIE